MSNPFLFDDEPDVNASPEVANPFLMEATATDATEEPTENPFAAPAGNPFVFDDDNDGQAEAVAVAEQLTNVEVAAAPAVPPPPSQPPTNLAEVDKAMSFFGTTITDEDDDASIPIEPTPVIVNEPPKKPPPPRPAAPLNQQTQELISSVADHLDQTSSHLLERIPKTRTPSPVSMRDLHSPSPTPEFANLLMSDAFEANASGVASDNPFVDADDFVQPDVMGVQQKIPARPAPPRPVPPPPPPVSQPAQQTEPVPEPQEPDLFGFESNAPPKPPAPKSNQDIMSLFSPPKAEPCKPDLLTSDIFGLDDSSQANISNVQPKVANVRPPVPPPPQRNPAATQPSPPAITTQPSPPTEKQPPAVIPRKPSIPKAPSIEQEAPPNEFVEAAAIKINDEPYTVQDNGFVDIEKSDTISDNSSAVESSFRSPGIATPATPFYSGTDPQILDRGQSPVSKEDEGDPYVNDSYVNPADALNPFGMPAVEVAKPTPHLTFPSDDFDAFSAKFDGSGYKSPAPNDGILSIFLSFV